MTETHHRQHRFGAWRLEPEAYDYALMQEQDDRGHATKVQKDIAKSLFGSGLTVEETAKHTRSTIEQVRNLSGK